MNELRFITPTKLSLLDITSMGDSSKRGDETKIGMFGSGFHYCNALLMRAGVGMKIDVYGGSLIDDGNRVKFVDTYEFSSEVVSDDSTGKEKDLIRVHSSRTFSDGVVENLVVKTSFAKNLGWDWELWQAYRELYSNMLDEGGYEMFNTTGDDTISEGTVITLTFDYDNPFAEIYRNRGNYINLGDPLAASSRYDKEVKVLSNPDGHLRIYKQSILVHENVNKPSKYAYDINFGALDERRLLREVGQVESSIRDVLMESEDNDFLSLFISPNFVQEQYEFLSNFNSCSWIGKGVIDKVHSVYEDHGEVNSFSWIIDSVKSQKECKLPGRKIKSLDDHIWSSLATVTVNSEPQEIEIMPDNSLKNQIEHIFNFMVDVCIKEADISGRKVVADKYNKCLIVAKDFTIEEHMHEFLIQYVDLTMTGNIIDNLAKMLKDSLKKS